jgi:hypothetical protein
MKCKRNTGARVPVTDTEFIRHLRQYFDPTEIENEIFGGNPAMENIKLVRNKLSFDVPFTDIKNSTELKRRLEMLSFGDSAWSGDRHNFFLIIDDEIQEKINRDADSGLTGAMSEEEFEEYLEENVAHRGFAEIGKVVVS